jgi:hypothetical protein
MDQHGHSCSNRTEDGTTAKHGARGALEKLATLNGWVERWIGRSWVGHPHEVSMGKMVYVKNAGGELTTMTGREVPFLPR